VHGRLRPIAVKRKIVSFICFVTPNAEKSEFVYT